MNKLNFFGVGPRIGLVVLPWLAVSVFLSVVFKNRFGFPVDKTNILFIAGLVILIGGLIFYFLTVPLLLKGLKETKLVTTGAFSLCCNPLYAAIILFIIPGIALMMNSWLVLSTTIAGYIVFKFYIKGEYEELERFFGDEYKNYRRKTPEFFPTGFRFIRR
ncbi:MAG TPA: isoprenylcysteine carboxylmethyltransferase family protein [Bacteroidales bacterium]|nr:isoprenylcysteine carboxylmethyltransferase family protein [Bacteroidales bacterium]